MNGATQVVAVSAPLSQQLARQLQSLIPLATALLAVILDAMPLPFRGLDLLTAFFSLSVVYFWCLYRPDLMTPGAVFLTGIVYDSLVGMPLGLTATVLLLVRYVVLSQQAFFLSASFLIVWLCFAVLAPLVEILRWFLAVLWLGRLFDVTPALFQAGLTVAMYPVVSRLLISVHDRIPKVLDAS